MTRAMRYRPWHTRDKNGDRTDVKIEVKPKEHNQAEHISKEEQVINRKRVAKENVRLGNLDAKHVGAPFIRGGSVIVKRKTFKRWGNK